MSLRKTLGAGLVGGLLLALSACGGNAAPQANTPGAASGGDVTLNFFHRWPAEPKNSYFADVVKAFEDENPNIKIEVESVLNDAYKDKVNVVAGSANAPDVMFTWSGTFIRELVRAEAAMSLDEWLSKNPEIADRYYPSQMEPLKVDGVQYALPIGMHSKVFFYNAEVFEKEGLTPPKTWSEFIAVLDKLKSAGYTPIEFGAQEQWPVGHYLGTFNQRVVGPEVFSADRVEGESQLTDPGYALALQRFQELAQYMNEDMTATTHEMARNAWMSGSAPIMYLQSAEIGYMTDVEFEYSVFNFPAVEGGKGDPQQLMGLPEGFMVSSKTEHPDEALKFLEFLLNKANGIDYTERTGELSAVIGAVEESEAKPIQKELAQQIIDASAMTPWLDNAYDPQIVQTYMSEAQLMLGGQRTPEQVMTAVQAAAARTR